MTEQNSRAERPVSVSIARQPIFDENKRLWGYELFCVGSDESTHSGFPEEPSVAISVASSAYICLQQTLDRGKTVIVSFDEKSILENLPYALPPVLASVKVSQGVCGQPPILELLNQLKSDGYLITVNDFTGNAEYEPLYGMADIITVDARNKATEALAATLAKARPYKALLLASRVEDPVRFKACHDLGFSLFHGPFFKSPPKMTVRKLTSNEVLRFSLLEYIEKDDPDFAQLAVKIQADVTISFRLLTYLNSAAFAFYTRIKSIQQAVTLLGWRRLKNWLRVVLLTDMSQSKEAHELVLLSAQRGRFLELIAREHDFWGFDPESMHLLGIFSLLDTLLALPMPEIVSYLPLDNKLKSALCREPNNEYMPLLHLAQYLEEARWEEGEKLIDQLNLDSRKVKAALQSAINWASELDSVHFAKGNGR